MEQTESVSSNPPVSYPGFHMASQFRPRALLEAAGTSILILSPSFVRLITPGHVTLFHQNLNLANIFGGIALDFVVIFFACTAFIWFLAKLPIRVREVTEACIAGFLIWLVLRAAVGFAGTVDAEEGNDAPHLLKLPAIASFSGFFRHHNIAIGLFMLLFFSVMAWTKRGSMRLVVRTVQICLASLSLCGLWIVPQCMNLAAHFRKSPDFDHSLSQSAPVPQQRIVWVLFDELSYKLSLEHPPEGMRFPAFEQLRSQSISFNAIQPVDLFTDRITTSVFMGRKIDRLKSTVDGHLLYWDPTNSRFSLYDPEKTIFGLANRKGWNPGIAGWHNPYCRIFPQVLTACSWSPYSGNLLFREMKSDVSVVSSALAVPRQYANRLLNHSSADKEVRQTRSLNYQKLIANTSKLIGNGKIGFVFVHLPVPHPPGIYSRESHQINAHGNYIDNLVLADDTLRQIRQEIAQTPWAANTTLIVSSDHSWRLPFWQNQVGWTAEEERASAGVFDTRPVFLVHFPTQTTGTEISAKEPELIEHDIIAAMLNGNIERPEDLTQFIASR